MEGGRKHANQEFHEEQDPKELTGEGSLKGKNQLARAQFDQREDAFHKQHSLIYIP